jgi:hypothetical protein
VPTAADCVTGHAEERQGQADHGNDDADRPEDRDFRDEPDNEKNDAENDHEELLTADCADDGKQIGFFEGWLAGAAVVSKTARMVFVLFGW